MTKMNHSTKKRITTWILALVMLIAACASILTACSNSSSSDDEEDSTTRTDTQTFANGDFEYFDDSDGAYMIASPDSWTRSSDSNSSGNSASSSTAKSGIVDTSLDWGDKFLYARNTYEEYQDEDDEDKLPDEYYTDIDNDYDIPGWDLAEAAFEKSEEEKADQDPDYEAQDFTLDDLTAADIVKVNPGTPWAEAGTEDKDHGTHVLMLHNYRTNNYGTATRYTSTSITLQPNTSAMFSVWVKTYGMSYADGETVDGDRGAYIRVTNTVGGNTQDPLMIKNIDTEKLNPNGEQNNGWVQYTVYLKASSYSATTFTVVLGLGEQVEGTVSSRYGYVQGYAFFDGLTYEVMTNAEYETAVSENSATEVSLDLFSSDDSKKFDVTDPTYSAQKYYALDLDVLKNSSQEMTMNGLTFGPTTEKQDGIEYGIEKYLGADDAAKLVNAGDAALSGFMDVTEITGNTTYEQSVRDAFTNYPFDNAQLILLYSKNGAPYTASLENSDLADTSGLFTLAKDSYAMISFWVKTSEMNGGTGATINLVNYETKTAIGAVDTTTLDTVDLKDDNGTTEDIFDGWQQCYFFVSNTTDSEITFTLEFSFGPTTLSDTTLADYSDGFAAFANFSYATLEKQEFDVVSTGTYAVSVSLTEDTRTADSSVVFDDPAYTGGTEGNSDIEKGFADLLNYEGVYGGSKYVGGEEIATGRNEYENAGLINKKYAATYYGSYGTSGWLKTVLDSYSLTGALDPANEWWSIVFGNDCTQPLLIVNTLDQAVNSYGYIGKTTSISASSYATISVRVKLSEGATAYVYLIDTSDPEEDSDEVMYKNPLSYSAGVSYRYDADGNLVAKDPDDPDYNEDTDVLLWKQDNGLWAKEENYSGSEYYANLKNYKQKTDDDGNVNLVDGSDNIIYYQHDGQYYRYYDEDNDEYSVPVKDFTESGVDVSAAMLQDLTNNSKALVQKIEGTAANANQWIYVNFYIASGSEAKNYRLEVWSGDREGTTQMAESSYVAFDSVSYDSLTADTFNGMIEDQLLALGEKGKFGNNTTYNTVDEIKDAYAENPASFYSETDDKASLIYYHFSLFDDKQYAPYDEDYDQDDTGDPYASYSADSYSDTVAYLKTSSTLADNGTGTIEYNTFVNFGASEISVSASGDDSTDDTTTDDGSGSQTNLWLLIPSIVLAAALFFTLIAMLIKKLLGNIKRNKVRVTPQYNAKRKRYIRKLRLEESEQDESESTPDVLPEEDEISEEDIYKVETEEEGGAQGESDEQETAEENPDESSDENKDE